MGLSLKNDYLDHFKIFENESSLTAGAKM
jgi:hypothetical protein